MALAGLSILKALPDAGSSSEAHLYNALHITFFCSIGTSFVGAECHWEKHPYVQLNNPWGVDERDLMSFSELALVRVFPIPTQPVLYHA